MKARLNGVLADTVLLSSQSQTLDETAVYDAR